MLADALGEVARGLDCVEFACGIPHLLKGAHSSEVSTGIDVHTVLHPVGVVAGITPFNFPVMVPLWMAANARRVRQRVRAQAVGARPVAVDAAGGAGDARPASPTVCSTSCTVTPRRSTRCSRIPTSMRSRSSASTPIARHVYETGTKHGKRVQALGGAKNHMVVLPDADLDGAADAAVSAAYGSAGERCMAISVVVAVGDGGRSAGRGDHVEDRRRRRSGRAISRTR